MFIVSVAISNVAGYFSNFRHGCNFCQKALLGDKKINWCHQHVLHSLWQFLQTTCVSICQIESNVVLSNAFEYSSWSSIVAIVITEALNGYWSIESMILHKYLKKYFYAPSSPYALSSHYTLSLPYALGIFLKCIIKKKRFEVRIKIPSQKVLNVLFKLR